MTRRALLVLLCVSVPRLPAAQELVVEKNLEARMRDGVVLRADVYRPVTNRRLPALLQRTPYSKNPADSKKRICGSLLAP